jgi:hypothetical protein
MQVRAGAQVGQRRMRKQQVPRGEAAVQVFGQASAAAEEGDLDRLVSRCAKPGAGGGQQQCAQAVAAAHLPVLLHRQQGGA